MSGRIATLSDFLRTSLSRSYAKCKNKKERATRSNMYNHNEHRWYHHAYYGSAPSRSLYYSFHCRWLSYPEYFFTFSCLWQTFPSVEYIAFLSLHFNGSSFCLQFVKYLKNFLNLGPPSFAPFCMDRLKRTIQNGTRLQPPSWIELQVSHARQVCFLSPLFFRFHGCRSKMYCP